MNILFLAKAPDATKFFRVDLPAKYLSKAGHNVRVDYIDPIFQIQGSGIKEADVEWSDVVVFQRPASETAKKYIDQINVARPNKVIIGEYDDDYASVPQWNPGYPYVKANEKHWKAMVPLYDGMIVSTPFLARVFEKQFKGPIKVIKNGFDFEVFDSLEKTNQGECIAPDPKSRTELKALYGITLEQFNELMKDKTVIMWAGSRHHFMDLNVLPKEIKRVTEICDDIVFLFVGYLQNYVVSSLGVNRLFIAKGRSPIDEFYRLIKSFKVDAYVAPLDSCKFNQSKSSLKIIEAMAIGALPICSEWDPYEDDIDNDDECKGWLCGYNQGDWVKAFLELHEIVKDKEKFESYKIMNGEYVRKYYSANLRSQEYVDFFQKMIDMKKG